MTKEYLKMADAFRDEMRVVGDSNNLIADDVGIIIGCYSGDKMAEYVLHAINSHDELVAEVELLRGAIHDAFIDGCQVGWDMTGEGYNAEYGGPCDGRLHEEFSAIFTERYADNMTLA